MFCPNCGKEIIDEEINFCSSCGKNLNDFKQQKLSVPINHLVTDKKLVSEINSNNTKNYTPAKVIPPKETNVDQKKPKIIDVSTPKQRKWGLGWIVIGGIVGTGIDKYYKDFGDNQSILYLSGVFLSIMIYFFLRNKILIRISNINIRSTLAGLIAWLVSNFAVIILAYFLVPNNVEDDNVTKVLESEIKQMKEYLYGFASKDKKLWGIYNDEPTTTEDINTNILVLNNLIPLYKEKDSVLIFSYRDIVLAMESSKKWKAGVPDLINDFRFIADKSSLITIENQKYLSSLLNYFLSIKKKDNQEDLYWDNYEKSFYEALRLYEELSPVISRVTGKDINKVWEELEKEYYK